LREKDPSHWVPLNRTAWAMLRPPSAYGMR